MTTPIYKKTTLPKRLEEAWKGLGTALCRSLVDSVPERLGNYLPARDEHFN